MLLKRIINNLKNPRGLFAKMLVTISPILSDRLYLSWRYRLYMKKKLNIDNPQTFNEKTNWLKLYYHLPIFTKLVDKYEVKKIVADIIGNEHIIPTIGVWEKVEDIDFSALPNRFVLKCTHDSGGLIVCKDKSTLDIDYARKKLSKALKRNYYNISREWGYKNIKARIIAEEYMEDHASKALNDYKFFCFNGVVKALFIATDRSSDVKFNFYDSDFNPLNVINGHPQSTKPIQKPKTFDLMKDIASKLSSPYPFMRVDLYEVDGRVYFGEYTLYHYGGTTPFEPEEFDLKMGNWLKLPEISD